MEMSNWNPVKLLGKGSYGTVFLAIPTTPPLDFVALKVVPINYAYSIMTEETILLNFKGCPEIVQCLGSGICFGGNFLDSVSYNLALEYAAGGSLTDLIRRRGKLPETEVKEYMRMIVRGLCCIHEQGYVHGDLKPDNILVFPVDNGKLKLKIADFGLCKRCDEFEEVVISSNAKPRFRGTPKYMSPESILFGKINTSLDIWSLGCILIEMISGKRVWSDCITVGQLVKKVVNQMDLPDIPEELSTEGRDFLLKCLDQNSERRWTANMLLKHPYLKEECQVDVLPSTWNLHDLLDTKSFKEEDFHGSYFELISQEKWMSDFNLPEDLHFSPEKKSFKEEDFHGSYFELISQEKWMSAFNLPEDLHFSPEKKSFKEEDFHGNYFELISQEKWMSDFNLPEDLHFSPEKKTINKDDDMTLALISNDQLYYRLF